MPDMISHKKSPVVMSDATQSRFDSEDTIGVKLPNGLVITKGKRKRGSILNMISQIS